MTDDNNTIYDILLKLPSPCLDNVDPLGLYDDLFAPLRESGSIEGLVTPLYQYQRAAVAQMLHQELYPPGYMPTLGELPLDTYPPELRSKPISCPYNCGKHHYSPVVNPLPYDIIIADSATTVRARGGILAEDPRSGKILELLALILLTKDQISCPTALDAKFTKAVCRLSYRNYLNCTLLPPYRYPGRAAKSSEDSNNDSGPSDDDHENDEFGCDDLEYIFQEVDDDYKIHQADDDYEVFESESSCLPGEDIVPPLRYLALRLIVHCPRLTAKAIDDFLPTDLKEIMWLSGFNYVEDNNFSTAYLKNPELLIPDNVGQHHQDLISFTHCTSSVSEFKAHLASLSSQGPKLWNRLYNFDWSYFIRDDPPPPVPTHLSRATLVVLPGIFLSAWASAIKKHVISDKLKCVTIYRDSIPSITTLLECDLALISVWDLKDIYYMSYPKKVVYSDNDGDSLSRIPHKSMPKCVRLHNTGLPNIYRILWKRVILKDCQCSRAVYCSRDMIYFTVLQSERRWVYLVPDSLVLDREGEVTIAKRFPYPNFQHESTALDTLDLGYYFSCFLKVPPFSFGMVWQEIGMFIKDRARRSQRNSVLKWLLTNYVIRNRSKDLRRETVIPPLTKRTVYLDCGLRELCSYNFLLAQIIAHSACYVNGWGKDFLGYQQTDCPCWSDYTNEPGCLWPTPSAYSSTGYLVESAYHIVRDGLKKSRKRGRSREEIELFRQCWYWMKLALRYGLYPQPQGWFGTAFFVDPWPDSSPVSMNIETTPETVLLTELPVNSETDDHAKSDTKPSDPSLITPVMLLDMVQLMELIEQVQGLYKNDDNAPLRVNTTPNTSANGETDRKRKRNSPLSDSGPPETNTESQHDLKFLTIRGCNSAKLTYLVNQLQRYAPYEKCVVYVNSCKDMDLVSQFLEFLFSVVDWDIMFWCVSAYWGKRMYSYASDVVSGSIDDFTTDDNCRVLITPTSLAFSGMDLSVASRVYFFSPVFYESAEAQAIRQVHNMRQTRSVHVETLVLRGTLEDTAFSYKGKRFERQDYTFHQAKTEQDSVIISVGNFLTPTWEDTTAVDDFSVPRGHRSTMAELAAAVKARDIHPQPRPEYMFDEPIPFSSLR
ncbi:hypothetical protein IWQ62_003463 [Dispira parvispora]|uniref:SNF2 N-terminal domain-containing protein n=1 Tax=Dispira parvispora TaxID=1520584 RepID=A0A9W8E6I3_9FUNG|nr:hypothetical protein IWQ62_003463 [Dispira parvispora]